MWWLLRLRADGDKDGDYGATELAKETFHRVDKVRMGMGLVVCVSSGMERALVTDAGSAIIYGFSMFYAHRLLL